MKSGPPTIPPITPLNMLVFVESEVAKVQVVAHPIVQLTKFRPGPSRFRLNLSPSGEGSSTQIQTPQKQYIALCARVGIFTEKRDRVVKW